MRKIRAVLALMAVGVFLNAGVVWAEGSESATNNAKLDQLISGQQEILQKLAELKDQLEIVKIRATNK